MGALENAKQMTGEEVIAKIASSGIKEYGIYCEAVADRWKRVLSENNENGMERKVIATLNNADTKGALLEVLEQNVAKVMEGIEIAAHALGATIMELYIPEYAAELAAKIEPLAKERGIELITGMMDIRDNEMQSMNHIVTMKRISDCMEGTNEEGTYISLNGASLTLYPNDQKLSDIAGMTDCKAVELGYQFYPASILEKTVGEVAIPNGVFSVLTDKNCLIHEVEERVAASRKQSCGKCVFCREGLIQLHGMVKDIADGKGKNEYTDIMEEIGSAMLYSTPCSVGQESAKSALSSIEYFTGEYEEHIKKKHCAANVCGSFQAIYIDPNACEGCEECKDVCAVDCIEGKKGFIHMIDDFECTKCGKCVAACEYEAIIQTSGRVPKLPDRLTKCGKFKKH
jgi:NAD-dependent dihydropyrimidine dehydrogenase PreA subunit